MLSPKAIDDMKRKLKGMLSILKEPITKEINEKEYWLCVVSHGQHIVLIGHTLNEEFMSVVFRVDFDKEALERLSTLQSNKTSWLKFMWGLKSIISSPLTAFSTNVDSDKNLKGFSVLTKVFPFHDGFTLKELNGSIQAVVSVGVAGVDYVGGNLGALEIQQKLSDIPPPPDGLYG